MWTPTIKLIIIMPYGFYSAVDVWNTHKCANGILKLTENSLNYLIDWFLINYFNIFSIFWIYGFVCVNIWLNFKVLSILNFSMEFTNRTIPNTKELSSIMKRCLKTQCYFQPSGKLSQMINFIEKWTAESFKRYAFVYLDIHLPNKVYKNKQFRSDVMSSCQAKWTKEEFKKKK